MFPLFDNLSTIALDWDSWINLSFTLSIKVTISRNFCASPFRWSTRLLLIEEWMIFIWFFVYNFIDAISTSLSWIQDIWVVYHFDIKCGHYQKNDILSSEFQYFELLFSSNLIFTFKTISFAFEKKWSFSSAGFTPLENLKKFLQIGTSVKFEVEYL